MMKKTMMSAFLFILLFSVASSGCNGSASMLVPAVIGDGSGMVNLSVRMVPGSGDVFISTTPQTGISTQISAEDAAYYAFSKSGNNDCDAIVKIDSAGSAGYVDGPSAGAALAVLTYGALEGKEPRRDAVMTGSVDELGNIGEVGGLYEKSMAAVAINAHYFIIPKANMFDILLLKGVKEKYGVEVLEATEADDAIGFMLYNKSLSPATIEREPEKLPDLKKYDTQGLAGFGNVTLRMLDAVNRSAQGLPGKDNDSAIIKSYYKARQENNQEIYDKGYLYAAANEAFLDQVEISTIQALLSGNVDLEKEKDSIESCLHNLKRIQKTDENFEFVLGAELREQWALQKLNSTDISGPMLQEEKYVVYNELAYADAWCDVSGVLMDTAGSKGNAINESAWKSLAEAKIKEAQEIENAGSQEKEHLASALAAYSEGQYGAAIYDAVWVVEMAEADSDLQGMKASDLDSNVSSMLAENRTSLWGNVYQSQGAYLAQSSSNGSAFSILRLAKGLDNATDSMREAAGISAKAESIAPSSSENQVLVFSIFLITIMLLFYISIRLSRKGR